MGAASLAFLLDDGWRVVFLSLCRLAAFFTAAPLLGSLQAPRTVKVAICLGLAAFCVGPAGAGAERPPADASYFFLCFAETLMGLMLGFFLRLVTAALDVACEMLANAMGLSFASAFDQGQNGMSSVLGSLASPVCLLAFCASGGLEALFSFTLASFSSFPPGHAADSLPKLLGALSRDGARLFALGLALCANLCGALWCAQIGLGILSRGQGGNILGSMGFALLMSVGLVLFALYLPFMAEGFTRMASDALLLGPGSL